MTSAVTSAQAADISGLFNTTTRLGGVIGTAAAGTAYLALVHRPGQAVPGFALLCTALAVTAALAAAMAALSVRRSPAGRRDARPVSVSAESQTPHGCLTLGAGAERPGGCPGTPPLVLPAAVVPGCREGRPHSF